MVSNKEINEENIMGSIETLNNENNLDIFKVFGNVGNVEIDSKIVDIGNPLLISIKTETSKPEWNGIAILPKIFQMTDIFKNTIRRYMEVQNSYEKLIEIKNKEIEELSEESEKVVSELKEQIPEDPWVLKTDFEDLQAKFNELENIKKENTTLINELNESLSKKDETIKEMVVNTEKEVQELIEKIPTCEWVDKEKFDEIVKENSELKEKIPPGEFILMEEHLEIVKKIKNKINDPIKKVDGIDEEKEIESLVEYLKTGLKEGLELKDIILKKEQLIKEWKIIEEQPIFLNFLKVAVQRVKKSQ